MRLVNLFAYVEVTFECIKSLLFSRCQVVGFLLNTRSFIVIRYVFEPLVVGPVNACIIKFVSRLVAFFHKHHCLSWQQSLWRDGCRWRLPSSLQQLACMWKNSSHYQMNDFCLGGLLCLENSYLFLGSILESEVYVLHILIYYSTIVSSLPNHLPLRFCNHCQGGSRAYGFPRHIARCFHCTPLQRAK